MPAVYYQTILLALAVSICPCPGHDVPYVFAGSWCPPPQNQSYITHGHRLHVLWLSSRLLCFFSIHLSLSALQMCCFFSCHHLQEWQREQEEWCRLTHRTISGPIYMYIYMYVYCIESFAYCNVTFLLIYIMFFFKTVALFSLVANF